VTSRRRFLGAVGSALAIGGLAGCGYRPGGGDVRWRADGDFSTVRGRALAVTDGLVVTVADSTTSFDIEREEWVDGGEIAAYSTEDGSELWSDKLDADLSGHAVGDGIAAVGVDGTIVRYDDDGRQWAFEVSEPLVALAVAGEWAYALTESGALVAASNGVERWWVDLDVAATGDDASEPMVAASTQTVVCEVGGSVRGFGPSGQRRWSKSELDARSLSVVDGEVFVSAGHGLAAIDSSTGAVRWIGDERIRTFAVTPDTVYGVADLDLYAYDRSGDRRWSTADGSTGDEADAVADATDYMGRVAADAGAVYVDSSRGLTALDAGDGRVCWRVENRSISGGPFVADSGVLVVVNGELVCHYRDDTS